MATLRFLRTLLRNRVLLGELIRRDLTESYAGSILAQAWAVLHPLMLFGVYLFVFGYIYAAKLDLEMPVEVDFAAFMLAGLAGWLGIQGALAKGATAITSAENLVKQVVFPVELLPVKAVISGMFPVLIGSLLSVVYALLRFGEISPMLPVLPFVLIWQSLMFVGLGLILSSLNVFVRDVRDGVQFYASFGLFILPVIYPPGRLPDWFETFLMFNPFSYFIWVLQDIFFYQQFSSLFVWIVFLALPPLVLVAGVRVFEKTREHFGDAL